MVWKVQYRLRSRNRCARRRTGGAASCRPACGAPVTISQSGGQLSSGKRASRRGISTFWGWSHRDSNSGTAAIPSIHPAALPRPFSKGLHGRGLSHILGIPVSECPLGDGGPAEDLQVWPEIQKALSLPIKAPSFQAKRGQAEGRGMDPPRRGGFCEADGG